ncbi:DUF6192 family protein [Streptomyces sp. NPDC056661]|uniref:DUF6192 family protein n=1 Tax=Streptomyces sp. NPDC056661 TaxID=3345898 RepID=UPI0036B4AA11
MAGGVSLCTCSPCRMQRSAPTDGWPRVGPRRTGGWRCRTRSTSLASILDDQERFEAVNTPRRVSAPARWTCGSTKRIVGWKVDFPESVQEKIEAIHDLAVDDTAAVARRSTHSVGIHHSHDPPPGPPPLANPAAADHFCNCLKIYMLQLPFGWTPHGRPSERQADDPSIGLPERSRGSRHWPICED